MSRDALSHGVITITEPKSLYSSFLSIVLFTMLGQLRRTLLGKRGGNISYCVDRIYRFTGFEQVFEPTSFRIEVLAHAVGFRFESCQWIMFLTSTFILSTQIINYSTPLPGLGNGHAFFSKERYDLCVLFRSL